MAKVNILNVVVLDNPCPFLNDFQFEITFECLEDLSEDLEWKITYVGSAESEQFDQTLDSVVVGPIVAGKHMFVFTAPHPKPDSIPQQDILGVTVVLLTCSYKNKEFIRVGYYVNNEYESPELKENPPATPQFDKLTRNVLASCPRVTRFKIDWDDSGENGENMPPPYNPETESNQMTVDQQQVSKLGNVLAPAGAMGENTMDGSVSIDMDLAAAKLQQHAVDISSSRTDPEAMES